MSTQQPKQIKTSSPGIEIHLMDNAHLRYDVSGFDTTKNPVSVTEDGEPVTMQVASLIFQSHRPGACEVPDGITDDTLAAILQSRIEAYNNSLAACPANTEALLHVQMLRGMLQRRSLQRLPIGQ